MNTKNRTIKLISSLLIFSIILPSVLFSIPKKVVAAAGTTAAIAVPTADIPQETAGWLSQALHAIGVPSTVFNTGLHVKDFANWLLQQVLKQIAKMVLARMTQATINWINSDFHGSPLFIENPSSFFRDIAKSEVRNLVDMIGYDTLKYPFGPQTALNVINSYKRQLADNSQYTLSKVINDPDLLVRYRNDFNFGGWNGFLVNTQYPQNNYLGFQSIIQQNLASRLEGTFVPPAQKIQNLLQQGMGFLSPQSCPSNPSYNNGLNEFNRPTFKSKIKYNPPSNSTEVVYDGSIPYEEYQAQADAANKAFSQYTAQYNADVATEKASWAETNACPGGLVNTTPGSVVGNHIMDALGSGLRQTELGAALGNSLSAIFDALLNHFLDKGLNALASTANPAPSGDNWSYNGNTLGGTTTSESSSADLSIPQNVSVTVGQSTSTNISGGKAPYSIQTPPTPGVASARISLSGSSGPSLTITGLTPGETLVEVRDSSTPAKIASVDISVNAIGALVVSPHNISTNINNPVSAIISGGKEPYTIQTGPNENIATVAFSDTGLIVSGIAPGQTSLTVKDSSTPPKTTSVQITISGPEDLSVAQNVLVTVGRTVSIPMSGGTAPYHISMILDSAVASAEITGPQSDMLTITGLVVDRQTAVIVQDSSNPAKTTSISVSVTPFVPLVLNPQNVSTNVGHTVNVSISGGTAPYVVQNLSDEGVASAQISSDSTLTITGVALGNSIVTIQDSSTSSQQTAAVRVKVVEPLAVNPSSISVDSFGSNQTATATISGGTAPYSIQSQNPTNPGMRIANYKISGSTLTVTAGYTVWGHSTSVTIKDSSPSPQTITVPVLVN